MAEFDEFMKIILSFALGSVITILATAVNNRQADKRLKFQVRRNDELAALTELDNLSKERYKTYGEFEHRIKSFLGTLRSEFLPGDLKALVQNEMKKINDLMVNSGLEPPRDEDLEESWAEAYHDWRESLTGERRAFEELKDMFTALRGNIRTEIKRYVATI